MQHPTHSRTLTLTDGHAGNVRQARALADALGLPTRDLTLEPRAPWRWTAPRRMAGDARAFGPGFRALLDNPATRSTLVIGCGRQAALATRLLRARGALAVQILDPRLRPTHWDAVVVPGHDHLRGANVMTLLGSLNPVDDGWLGASRAAFASLGALPGPRTALLVGGPTSHMPMGAAQLGRWLAMVRGVVEHEGGSVLATTSRRTPPALVDRVRRSLEGLPGLVWTGSVDGRNPYAALLGWADRIVCTPDSVNMLSEASATRVPVFAPGLDDLRGRPARFAAALQAQGRIRPLDGTLAPFDVVPLRETARIAGALRERFALPVPRRAGVA